MIVTKYTEQIVENLVSHVYYYKQPNYTGRSLQKKTLAAIKALFQ